jgi:GntR family transcriptional regulator
MRREPRYLEIRRSLVQELSDGRWPVGQAIDSEQRLARRFGVAIGTLRRAVDDLVAEGVLVRRQGLGTFVNRHSRDRLLYYFFHVVPHNGPKLYPEVSLVSFARDRASREERLRLDIPDRSPVIRVRNTLSVGGRVAIVDDITIASARFKGLTEAAFRGRESTIYDLYQERFGQTVARASERLRAVAAPRDIAGLLGVEPASPLLAVRRLALGLHDDPIEWRVSHVHTRDVEYFNELVR